MQIRRLTFLLLGDASLCYFHLFSFDLRHICLTFIGTPITFWILFASSWRNFHHRVRHPNCWSFEIGWGYRHSISPSADGYYALGRSYTPSSVQKGNSKKILITFPEMMISYLKTKPFLKKGLFKCQIFLAWPLQKTTATATDFWIVLLANNFCGAQNWF